MCPHAEDTTMVSIARIAQSATVALAEGRSADVVRRWRTALARCRVAVDSLMRFAQQRADIVPGPQRKYLTVPYALPNIVNLVGSPGPG